MELDQLRQQITKRPHFRLQTIERSSVNVDKRTVELTFASETPVERWWGFEILSHSPKMVHLDRWLNKPPFLQNHRDRRGVIENGRIENGRLAGTARISRSEDAEELLQDMADGIAVHTSCGYMVLNAQEMKPEEMSEDLKRKCLEKGAKAYRCEWEPLEGSSVDIPADISVGLDKRSLEFYDLDDLSNIQSVIQAVRSFDKSPLPADSSVGAGPTAQPPSIQSKEKRTMEETTTKASPAPLTEEELKKFEQARVKEIEDIGARFAPRIRGGEETMKQLVRDAVELKRSVEAFRGDVYVRVNDTQPLETPDSFLDLPAKDLKRYRLRNVILAQMKHREGGVIRDVTGEAVDTTLEEECSAAIAKKIGPSSRNGLYVPFDVQLRQTLIDPKNARSIEKFLNNNGVSLRDLTVGSAHAAGDLVGTDLLAGSFIELLRNKALFYQLGVQRMTGLIGNIAIPRQTTAGTFYWVAENTAPAGESAIVTDQVTMSPNEGGMYMDYSRRLLLQATPSIDLIVQNDIVKGCALGIDVAIAHGSGGTQPTGICSTSGIGDVDGAGFGWEQAVEFETDVASANADVATMSYVMGAAARGTLKTRLKALNTAEFLIDRDGKMNGYPVNVTNQIQAGYIIFGDYSQVAVGEWGTLDLLVDPYTGSSAGTIRVRAFIAVDVAVKQPSAFSVCSDLA